MDPSPSPEEQDSDGFRNTEVLRGGRAGRCVDTRVPCVHIAVRLAKLFGERVSKASPVLGEPRGLLQADGQACLLAAAAN